MTEPDMKYLPSSLDGEQLHTLIWDCGGQPAAVIVLVHGMAEHIARYDEFARSMNDRNIAVVGASLLGHGLTAKSSSDLGFFAEKNGAQYLLKDVNVVRTYAQQRFPNVPCFILGHSFGSFVTRAYLCTDMAKGLSGAIISGTGDIPPIVVSAGASVAGIQKAFGLKHKPGRLINYASFGSYNKGFEPDMDGFAWLSKNEPNVRQYAADPLCGFCFTVGAFSDMFAILKSIRKTESLRRMDKALPVLLIAGSEDPVGERGAAVKRVRSLLMRIGIKQVDMKLYAGDRHEVLNELDRADVYNDICGFVARSVENGGDAI